jgi:DNA (cytosine-5)-methyltransferase 1
LSASEYKQPTSVLIPISFAEGQILGEIDTAHCLNALQLTKEGVMTHQQATKVCMPVLTPDRAEKRQNGRRFKDDGEESFTLTAQDIHGVAISVSGNEVNDSEQISRCLNANDQRKVFGAKQERTMVSIPVKEATKTGYAVAHEGDSINLTAPDSHTRRGRVGGGQWHRR